MEETTLPITKEFLENILKRKIDHYKVSSGSNPGDNYMSILISLEVHVADAKDPLHLLFKTFPFDIKRQQLLEHSNIFWKEYQVYDIWLPELIKLQKDVIGNEKLLVPAMPELLAGAAIDYDDPTKKGDSNDWKNLNPMLSNFLLMVDVRATYGFKMANRLQSLGYQHAKVVLEELAKYHALGYAYKIHNKVTSLATKFSFMEDQFWCNPDAQPMLEALMTTNVQLVIDTCKDLLDAKPEIADSLSKFKDPVVPVKYVSTYLSPKGMNEKQVEGYMREKPEQYSGAPLEDQWIVPVHGDAWTNNMLFKHDANGKVASVVLVDLQISRESCITSDIALFLFTGTDTDFRKQYLDEMLKWYYDRFVHFCEILKTPLFPGFSLDNFKRKFHRSKIFGLLLATVALPLILKSPESTGNLETVEAPQGNEIGDGEEFADLFLAKGRDEDDTKLLRDRFTALLSELHDDGVL